MDAFYFLDAKLNFGDFCSVWGRRDCPNRFESYCIYQRPTREAM